MRSRLLLAVVALACSAIGASAQAGAAQHQQQPSTTTATVDFEAVLARRLVLNSTQGSNDSAAAGEEVSLESVLDTLQHLLAAPAALNDTFLRAAELGHPLFWEVVGAARVLAGLDTAGEGAAPGDAASQIAALAAKVAQLPDHLCWPVLRRIVVGAVVQRRLSQGPLSAAAQAAVTRLFARLYLLHKQAAGRKGVIDFFHASKAGGTTFCQLAKLNGCRTQSFAARRNCLIREFDDVPRWVNHSLHTSLAPVGLRTPWFANWGNKARNPVSCRVRKRFAMRRRFNIYANEFSLYGAARAPRNAHVCPGNLNVLQLRHPHARLRSHLMWVWALYDHHFKEQAAAFFPSHGAAHWEALMPAATHNYYVRSLLGEAVYYSPPDKLTAAHLASARLSAAQFDVVTLLEQPAMNDLLYEMAVGWGLGFGDVRARTSSAVHDVGRRGLPEAADWAAMVGRNQLDLELYRFGAMLAMLDAVMFDVARAAGLGGGFVAAAVSELNAVTPGGEEKWEVLGGNGTRAGSCGFVAAYDADVVLPRWLVV
ncbi:hypothetical protein TSOC_009792 [Tetrabaena socialis]|uniref:Uncharacterized protein n=1 Tax=Tetrabaena socialis TaxID=47790 RepID=A0A2J7ZUX9_9CHLO|nr:hypothetical protein TSOC_009792 [Tetrabaena socialis]|eukprot:PNH04083.1 hypothetical protein TSOC_009792 [Tetrabaena socialis]